MLTRIDNYESEVSEAMMSDREGRRITPKVLPPGHDPQPSRYKSKAEQEAEQTRAQAEQRARDIGPAVDRGGATLATDKRRQAYRDDDVAMVVDDDD